MRFGFGVIAAGVLVFGLVTGPLPDLTHNVMSVERASASGCGSVYTVQSGDTLTEIAERVYGKSARYREIFDANRDRLQDPARIRKGDTILLPCLGLDGTAIRRGAAQATLDAGVEAQVSEPTGAIPPPAPARLVTATGLAPFTDERLDTGGMISDLVTRALAGKAAQASTRITFVDDWAANLDDLLPQHDADVSFPWFKPDCSGVFGSGTARRLCSDYAFSDPLYQITLSYYARAGDPLTAASAPSDLAGKALCRAGGTLPPGLVAAVVASGVSLRTAPDLAECFERLHDGQTDSVIALKAEADRLIRDIGLDAETRAIAALETRRTLHAVVLKSSPHGAAYLAALNQGLANLKASGEWFRIVSAHNAERNPLGGSGD